MANHKFKLGNKIRDKVSGLEGITTGRIEYLNGCVQYNVHPPVGKDGKPPESYYYDQQQLEFIDDGIAEKDDKPKPPTGGAPSTVASIL